MKKIILIKFGGSIITDKTSPLTPNISAIKDLSAQFAQVSQELSEEYSFIIGNGAGSYGHYFADKYKLANGARTKDQFIGFSTEQYYDTDLNHLILKYFIAKQPLVQAFHPSSMFAVSGGKVKEAFIDPIVNALNLGITPSVYGNIVCDDQRGCSILSTEEIFHQLINRLTKKKFQIAQVVFLTSIAGFQRGDGSVISQVNPRTFIENKKHLYNTKGFDVTGGMKQKITEALKLAKQGIQTRIVNGNDKDILINILLKGESSGTTVCE